MQDITARTPRQGRWARGWWIWPVALPTLGWALALAAYAWNHLDEQQSRPARRATPDLEATRPGDRQALSQPTVLLHGRVLVEHGLVLRAPAPGGGAATVTHWLFPVVDAGARAARGAAPSTTGHERWTVKHVLRVAEGAPLRALSQAPDGPWLVTYQGATTSALAEALRGKGLQVDASAALVDWHSSPIEP